ncbi:porin family protein [Pontibacter pamirensis]|uniref:porin family protein n=1 Tax=Pontibacter pamirensis TaxID=2562824 RepID=UPI0013895104|nr:porin family protein [Pontibacter pamirensis]
MKKVILALTLLVCSIEFSHGQIELGIKAGGALANMELRGVEDSRIKPSYYFGAFSEVNLTEKLIIRPEVLYSSKGTRFSDHEVYGDGLINYNYISVPVLAGFKVNEGLKLLVGPEINLLAGYYSRYRDEIHTLGNPNRKVDWAFNWGLAYSITSKLGVEVRYAHGLRNYFHFVYFDQDAHVHTLRTVGANKVFQVGLTYTFLRREFKKQQQSRGTELNEEVMK